MNVLDENIIASQSEQLRSWGVSVRQIGRDLGRQGMDDISEIIPLLHGLSRPTFFTRDSDFYDRTLCHSRYCLVVLSVGKGEAAEHVRRFLRHEDFDTHAKRMGVVACVNPTGITWWERSVERERSLTWSRLRRL